jgi:Protein of unknown function (DUF1186)
MDAQAILHELTYADDLPREALKVASAQRVEMLPLFLTKSKPTSRWHLPLGRNRRRFFFIFRLLGEWREKDAYRPPTRLLRLPAVT